MKRAPPAPSRTNVANYLVMRRGLQLAICILAFIPIGTGLAVALFGLTVFQPDLNIGPEADSHSRYFAGLLLAIGLAFLAMVPRIEVQGVRFRLLTAIVFVGGIARLAGLLATGHPTRPIIIGLTMELVVTPILALCREYLERLHSRRDW